MKKQLIVGLVTACVMALSLSLYADFNSLLTKVPANSQWIVCIDSKQAEPAFEFLMDSIEKIIPEDKKQEFREARDNGKKAKARLDEKFGLNDDSQPCMCFFGDSMSFDMKNFLILSETSIPEETIVKKFSAKLDDTKTSSGMKLYFAPVSIFIEPAVACADKTNTIVFNGNDNFYFAYLDPKTVISSFNKDSVLSYLGKIGGITPVKFFGQESLSKNPVLWLGTNIMVKDNNEFEPKAQCKGASLTVSFDPSAKNILVDCNAEMLDMQTAQMIVSTGNSYCNMALGANSAIKSSWKPRLRKFLLPLRSMRSF